MDSDPPGTYMSVREAIVEQERARTMNRLRRPNTVRQPPTWGEIHSRPGNTYPGRTSEKARSDGMMQHSSLITSNTSSVHSPGGLESTRMLSPGALGGSSKSGLNQTATYHYGEAPLKPVLCAGNQYSTVGSYSMFGSQAVSDRYSSSAFGFGSSTRDQMLRTYISPAHLKDLYGKFSPAPDKYTLQSSLGRQVIDFKMSYPARSFGNEDRFDADRRDARAAQTPGPGAYRV